MRALHAVPAVLGLLAAVTVTGCHSSRPGRPPGGQLRHGPGQRPRPGAGPPGPRHVAVRPHQCGFVAGRLHGPGRPRGGPQRADRVFAAAKGIPVSDVPGTTPGSVYYGYDAATATYWAQADFRLATRVPLAVQVGFQDGASTGFFKRSGSGAWQVPSPISRSTATS